MSLLTKEEVNVLRLTSADAFELVAKAEAALLAKLASAELPEPAVKLHGKHKNGKPSAESMTLYTADQLTAWGNTRYAQGAAAQLSAEPVARFVSDDDCGHVDLIPHQGQPLAAGQELYTRRQA